jgi:pilus assembly protein CpaF
MLNGSDRISIEKHGQIQLLTDVSISQKSLEVAVRNIARRLGDNFSEEKPIVDSRLRDGSRVAAVLPRFGARYSEGSAASHSRCR